jgi:hypothetical protein
MNTPPPTVAIINQPLCPKNVLLLSAVIEGFLDGLHLLSFN